MAKQIILIILLTVAAVFFKAQLNHVLDGLVFVHNAIAGTLARIFSTNDIGRLIQDIISLLFIPLGIGVALGAAFWLVKHEAMPNVMTIVWVIWIVLLTTMIAQHGMQSVPGQSPNSAGEAQITQQEAAAPAEQAAAPE